MAVSQHPANQQREPENFRSRTHPAPAKSTVRNILLVTALVASGACLGVTFKNSDYFNSVSAASAKQITTSERDVISGQSQISVGEANSTTKRFLSCFPVESLGTELTTENKSVLLSYQIKSGIKPTGEIDQQTVQRLQADGIINITKDQRRFELGPKFFPLIINPDNQADCLRFSRNFLAQADFGQHSHSLEDLLIQRGEYLKVVKSSLAAIREQKVPSDQDRTLEKRLTTIQQALQLGITRPLMFTNHNLEQLVENYRSAKPTNFNACFVVASDDYNGGLYNVGGFNELASYFLRNKANVRFVMPTSDQNLKPQFANALKIDGVQGKADFVVYCFHGFATGFRVGPSDRQDAILTVGEGHLHSLNPLIKNSATEILYSCSTANSSAAGNNETLAASLFRCRSNQSEVIAPQSDCNLLVGKYVNQGAGEATAVTLENITEPLIIKFFNPTKISPSDHSKYGEVKMTRYQPAGDLIFAKQRQ